jgi:ribosomal protein S7
MLSGKKHHVELILIDNLVALKKKKHKTTFFFLLEAIELGKPCVEVLNKRRGKVKFLIAFPTSNPRQYRLSILFITLEIRRKQYSLFRNSLYFEILYIIFTRESRVFNTLDRIYT